MSMPVRRGRHAPLEAEADRLIRDSLQGVTKHSAKSDILTPWKEAERYRREVYVASGTPDPAIRRGMFHRKASKDNPHLNARDGIYRARRIGGSGSGLAKFVAERRQPMSELPIDGFDDE